MRPCHGAEEGADEEQEARAVNRRTFALWCLIFGPLMLVAELFGYRPFALRVRGETTWGNPQPLSEVWWHPLVLIGRMGVLFALAEAYHRWGDRVGTTDAPGVLSKG
jgi:hypothetical protein